MIYFIRNGRTRKIKIGVSVNPMKRLAQLQASSPEPLKLVGVLLGDFKDERELHARFSASRLCGEWFKETAELRDYIKRCAHKPKCRGRRIEQPPTFGQMLARAVAANPQAFAPRAWFSDAD